MRRTRLRIGLLIISGSLLNEDDIVGKTGSAECCLHGRLRARGIAMGDWAGLGWAGGYSSDFFGLYNLHVIELGVHDCYGCMVLGNKESREGNRAYRLELLHY